ncbi:hypothetical protein K469DRAFT_574976 [Zopfia rhizophila CBS 207.26]|uniref:F-box domain-containing protein n=1 Tax=Zopfia rhizophila CBS 207.26 TaxID=1314779 RepID=A0A6A6E5B2_9PEZI|nr:hypothetical protein K469DRAFT_574976 [Zopfia rhizophila CBS 207.26]
MNRLPQELIDRISSFLPKHDLKNILTLTTKFRYAAERYSSAFAEFTINERNSEKFLALYSGHRLLYLREVIFRPRFSPIFYRYEPELSCRENADELREKDESFTRQIKFLFTTLRSVEEQAEENHAAGRYRLSIYSPTRLVEAKSSRDCLHHHYVSWRVHLLNPAELPQIASVRSLEIHNHGYEYPEWHHHESKLDLRVIIDLATKLPNLEYLGFQTGGYEWCPTWAEEEPAKHYEHDWEGPRRDARHDFASAVTSCSVQLPSSLKRASMDFLNPLVRTIDIHQGKGLPNLVSPAQTDPFSSSLRIMSNNLRQLRLRAMVDGSLFWPDNDAASFWPNLERLEVMFHIARPDGKWYFQGPGGEGHNAIGFEITDAFYPPFEMSELDAEMDAIQEEWGDQRKNDGNSQFRITPHQTSLRPLLEGFAKAATRMRSLKQALIWSPLSWFPNDDSDDESEFDKYDMDDTTDLAWGIAYAEPGLPPGTSLGPEPFDLCPSRQLWWMVAQWRPDPELHDLFQRIGRDKHGQELRELWTEDIYGDSLVYRDAMFEEFMFFHDPGRIPLSR